MGAVDGRVLAAHVGSFLTRLIRSGGADIVARCACPFPTRQQFYTDNFAKLVPPVGWRAHPFRLNQTVRPRAPSAHYGRAP